MPMRGVLPCVHAANAGLSRAVPQMATQPPPCLTNCGGGGGGLEPSYLPFTNLALITAL